MTAGMAAGLEASDLLGRLMSSQASSGRVQL